MHRRARRAGTAEARHFDAGQAETRHAGNRATARKCGATQYQGDCATHHNCPQDPLRSLTYKIGDLRLQFGHQVRTTPRPGCNRAPTVYAPAAPAPPRRRAAKSRDERGRALTAHSHDYRRNGSTLFAAFEVATGKVTATHKNRRRRIEFLDFMNDIVADRPDTAIHVILDDLRTHKPKNDRWLKRHPNVHFHFTPTRASWLNQVEIWFSILQGKSLHGASFTSVKQLREHIDAFIETYNQNARPFVWTKAEVHQRRIKGRRISQL